MSFQGDISPQLDEVQLGDPPIVTRSRSPSPPPFDTQQVPEEPEQPPTELEHELEEPPSDGDLGSVSQDQNGATQQEREGPRLDASAEQLADEEEGFEAVTLDDEQDYVSHARAPSTTSAPTPPLSDSISTTPADASSSALPPSDTTPPVSPTSLKSGSTKGAVPDSTQAITISVPGQEPETAEPSDSTPAPTSPTSPRKSLDASKQPRLGTKTPNVLQKLVSMTRQRDLPPKSKEEEKKHLRELDEMRTAAKEAEKRRQAQLATASAARNAKIASAFPTWESAILPNWRAVLHDDAEGKSLRKLWWAGTMPVRWRGRLWGLCIGNGLAVSKGSYAGHLERGRRGVSEGRLAELMESLEADVEDTLPTLKLFQKGGVMHDELVDVLLAYAMYAATADGGLRPPKHFTGLACPAAMLLVNLPVVDAWVSLVNLVNKSYLKSFYSHDDEECEAYFRIFDTLLADSMPKIYENFSKEVVRPALYLFPWLTSLYVRFLPLDLATRIFDIFLLEGDSFLFRVALVLLQILEPRLFNPVLSELDAVFKGEDRGAVAIVKRQKTAGWGGANEEDLEAVQVEEVYTEMGVTEQSVFRGLEEMVWREETWERLVTRELPEAD